VFSTGFASRVTVTNNLPPIARGGRTMVYQTTFYPSTTTATHAESIPITSGAARTGIDVQLQLVPGTSVSGVLMGASGPVPDFPVDLFPADNGDGAHVLKAASARTDASGAFTFPLVPSGQYVISALAVPPPPASGAFERASAAPATAPAPSRSAALPIGVGDAPIANLVVTLQTGVRIAGHVEFHGAAGPPAPEQLARTMITLPFVERPSRDAPTTLAVSIASNQFEFASVAPGRYFLRAPDVSPGWTVESITAGARDITDDALTVADRDIPDITVVYTDHPMTIAGTVRDINGAPDPSADVCLFPSDRTRWTDAGATSLAVQTVRVAKNGAFTIPRAIAGEYFVIAIPDEEAADWPDTALLAKLSSLATTVRVAPGSTAPLALTTQVIR
jgi:hypothetical protein